MWHRWLGLNVRSGMLTVAVLALVLAGASGLLWGAPASAWKGTGRARR
jgi:hypothetical protein